MTYFKVKDDYVPGPITSEILQYVDAHLVRHGPSLTEFGTIQDIVDRTSQVAEEELHALVPVPLYLGLFGTMMGVIIGLISMGYGPVNSNENIQMLLSGVMNAMIASACGLGLTTWLTAITMRQAKTELEANKNRFYQELKTKILITEKSDFHYALGTLASNLATFNGQFAANNREFASVFSRLSQVSDSQYAVLQRIAEIDVVKVTKANAQMLDKLTVSTGQLEKFNTSVQYMGQYLDALFALNRHIEAQLNRTEEVRDIAEAMRKQVSDNEQTLQTTRQMLELMQSEYTQIRDRGAHIGDAVNWLDTRLQKSIDDLSVHFQKQIQGFVEMSELNAVKIGNALDEERNSISNLKKIASMEKAIQELKTLSVDINRSLKGLSPESNIPEEVKIDLKDLIRQVPKEVRWVIRGLLAMLTILLFGTFLYWSYQVLLIMFRFIFN